MTDKSRNKNKNKNINKKRITYTTIIIAVIITGVICFYLGLKLSDNRPTPKITSQNKPTLNKNTGEKASNSISIDKLPKTGKVKSAVLSYQILVNEIRIKPAEIINYQITKLHNDYYGIQINLNAIGASRLKQFTSSHLKKPCQFVINNKIISLSLLRSEIGESFIIPVKGEDKAKEILNELMR